MKRIGHYKGYIITLLGIIGTTVLFNLWLGSNGLGRFPETVSQELKSFLLDFSKEGRIRKWFCLLSINKPLAPLPFILPASDRLVRASFQIDFRYARGVVFHARIDGTSYFN